MSGQPDMFRQQRAVAIACALAATIFGIGYLVAAGAPPSRSVVNAAAFALGLVALLGIGGALQQVRRYSGPLLLVMGSALMVTAALGSASDGASRWVMVGPLSVQVTLVVLPFMAVTFARFPTFAGCAGIAVAALALALQPDRGMAGALAFGMAALLIARPTRLSAAALIAAAAAFLVTLVRPDTLPAVPYVDRILFTAFDVHWAAGAAVWLGSLLLLVPPVIGWRRSVGLRPAYVTCGAIWFGCIAAAALGNYPTPVVGYGGSAILGYLLAFAFLPATSVPATGEAAAAGGDDEAAGAELRRSVSLA